MKAQLNNTGMKYYSVKIIEEFDLEEDPKASCKNYKNIYGYGKVCFLPNLNLINHFTMF